MFITKQDLDASLYPEVAAVMSRYTDAIIDMNLSNAVGEIQTMLGSRYDIAAALATTGAARHPYLLSIARDLAIYHLYSLQETIPAHRTKRYDQAIEMLKLIQAGKSTLPGVDPAPVPVVTPVSGQVGWGSGIPRPTWI